MKKKKIKLCLTKQLLNMFKLWCEWGIRAELNLVFPTGSYGEEPTRVGRVTHQPRSERLVQHQIDNFEKRKDP